MLEVCIFYSSIRIPYYIFLCYLSEVIKFGERVDAPPVFSGKFRKELDPIFANAGSKDLLLKRVLENNMASTTIVTNEAPRSSKHAKSGGTVSAEERQRIIDMHRALKKVTKQRAAV